jgi:hypothetical protein
MANNRAFSEVYKRWTSTKRVDFKLLKMNNNNLFSYNPLNEELISCFTRFDEGFYRGGVIRTADIVTKNGYGIMAFDKVDDPNYGNIYEGYFLRDKIYGNGALFYSDDKGIGPLKGGVYYGLFVEEVPKGQGKYI